MRKEGSVNLTLTTHTERKRSRGNRRVTNLKFGPTDSKKGTSHHKKAKRELKRVRVT